MRMVGSNPVPDILGLEELPGRSHYFRGQEPARWLTNVPHYSRVEYRSVYPGIDVSFYGNPQQLEFDFIVHPEADPARIRLEFEGTKSLHVDGDGNLVLENDGQQVRLLVPHVYQENNGRRVAIPARYRLLRSKELGFEIGPYDGSRALVIDPVLSYATFLGGTGNEGGLGIALDAAGNAYVTGETLSTDFPTTLAAEDTSCGSDGTCNAISDAFVSKISADGTTLLYSTYLGGEKEDIARGIAVDSEGNAYVAGETWSSDFPATDGAFDTTCGSDGRCNEDAVGELHAVDAFVVKLSSDGHLAYATFLGGMDTEFANAISVDAAGRATVVGRADSFSSKFLPFTFGENELSIEDGFPWTPGAFENDTVRDIGVPTRENCFATQFEPSGSALRFSALFGPSCNAVGVDLDSEGNVLIAGRTTWARSPDNTRDLPLVNSFQGENACSSGAECNPGEAYIMKFNSTASNIVYSTLLGGQKAEEPWDIAVDSSGNAYVTGFTQSDDFPTANACEPDLGGAKDAFVAKFNPVGGLVFSTYLGGSEREDGRGIGVDGFSNVYVTGWSSSDDFPFENPLHSGRQGFFAAFLTTFRADGQELIYSTFLGGGDTVPADVAVDSNGRACITGGTVEDFPATDGVFQRNFGGGSSDAFVACVEEDVIRVNSAQDYVHPETDTGLKPSALECDTGREEKKVTRPDGSEEPECTLRAAIDFSNMKTEAVRNNIIFDIPGGEEVQKEIYPERPLPEITHPVFIDGTTQPGFSRDPLKLPISVSGERLPQQPASEGDTRAGFLLTAGSTRIEGLLICCFGGDSVVLQGSGNNQVRGNAIVTGGRHGIRITDSSMNLIFDNQVAFHTGYGILVDGEGFRTDGFLVTSPGNLILQNVIGLDLEDEIAPNESGIGLQGADDNEILENVISGNTFHGLVINNGARQNLIKDNLIGTDRTGTLARGNRSRGILMRRAFSNLIESNVVSGNAGEGVAFLGDNSSNDLIGNFIGSTPDLQPLPNKHGILFEFENAEDRPKSNTVGYTYDPESATRRYLENVIAFNRGAGVFVQTRSVEKRIRIVDGNPIRRNRIFGNGSFPILITQPDAVLAREPTLHSAVVNNGQVTIGGTVNSRWLSGPGFAMNYQVEFFLDSKCVGDGESFLGSTEARVEEFGWGGFRATIPGDLQPGQCVSATATDLGDLAEGLPGGSTSEFGISFPADNDSDGDGTSDEREDQVGSGDGNNDGIPDREQNNVISDVSPVTGESLRMVSGPAVSHTIANIVPPPASKPNDVLLPQGMIALEVTGEIQDQNVSRINGAGFLSTKLTVTLLLPPERTVTGYVNFGPTPSRTKSHYYDFLYDGATGAEILPDRIILHFVDGMRGDHDLEVNGTVTTLGGPTIYGFPLFVPFFHSEQGAFAALAVSNLSENGILQEFSSFEADGSVPSYGVRPRYSSLASGHQSAQLESEILPEKPDDAAPSWLRVVVSDPNVGSFFQFGTSNLSQLDGSVAFTEQGKTLYFTRVFQGDTGFRGQKAETFLSVANPNTEPITVHFNIIGQENGAISSSERNPQASRQSLQNLALEVTREIPARGYLYESVSELFEMELSVSGAYIQAEVTEGKGAVGFQLVRLPDHNTVIGLNASFGKPATESFSAQLATQSGELFTNVNLVNTSEEPRSLILTAFAEDGTQLTQPVFRMLNPGEQLSEDAASLFASPQEIGTSFVGSLKVEADGPGVIGDVIFGDPTRFEFAAALPLQTKSFLEAVFSQVANVPGFFTGLAFFAPEEDADITIEVRAADGTLLGESPQFLEAGRRISKLVPQLAPDSDGQAEGYILIRSTAPLIAQQLFGALGPEGIRLLSAVPPTVLAEPDTEENPLPVLTSLQPSSARQGGASFTLQALGSGFIEGSEVRWNGEARVTTVISSQELRAAISASDVAEAGTAQVTVFNPPPGGGLSGARPFQIESYTAPIIVSVEAKALDSDSVEVTLQLEDPDGDIVKLEFFWFLSDILVSTREVNSPQDVDLTGFTSGTLKLEFTELGVDVIFGTVLPNEVEVVATDAQGLASSRLGTIF